MPASSSVAEADCPDEAAPQLRHQSVHPDPISRPSARTLVVEHRPVDAIPARTWDGLASRNPWATPFSAWAFQRAWWDSYGPNAHDETLVARDPSRAGDDGVVGIVPLMRRHTVEPSDAATHTDLRHGTPADLTPVPATARTLFMGASYHADYATILAAPEDLRSVCQAVVAHLSSGAGSRDRGDGSRERDDGSRERDDGSRQQGDGSRQRGSSEAASAGAAPAWDAVDLRRLRCGDPSADELAAAFGGREIASGWTLNLEREDVCPVTTIPAGSDFDAFLATLDKKERHEIRRKLRRADAIGEVRLLYSPDPLADLGAFIDLHQARWGDAGLFPATPGGDQGRRFVRRLFELFGSDGPLRLTFLWVGDRRIAAGLHFETPDAFLYYNAGMDPDALDLSPGILMVASYVRLAIARGRRRLDFLRGDEPYKYAWGAVDEPIRRLLVRRTGLA